MRNLRHLLAACLLLASFPAIPQQADQAHLETVRAFMSAFNAQDSGAMARLVADDVQWLSVAGDTISVETDGKAALVSAMNEYFRSCPTCRSRLTEIMASRDRVSTVETATWQGKDGPKTQSAVAVYEFSGGLIQRVYYFPAETPDG